MNLNENIYRLKELMGILTEDEDKQPEVEKDCYPSDYEPGKKYERDDLSKMFSCFAGDGFPIEGVKEWMFPMIPTEKGHVSPSYDPKNMQFGPNEFYTMEELVNEWKNKVSKISLEKISITPEELHPETLSFISKKQAAPMYKKRVDFQINKAKENGIESLTENEPFVVELEDNKYKWDEGWHRFLALYEMVQSGDIPRIEGKAWVVNRIK